MTTETRTNLGLRIRTMREESGMSLRTCADMMGINKDYLGEIELAKKSPTLDTLVKISAGFNVTLSELLQGLGPEKRPNDEDTPYFVTRF